MIIGIGVDIVRVSRVAKLLENPRFADRIFTPAERQALAGQPNPAQWAAGRYAVKEAVAKALGGGLSGCPPHKVEVLALDSGQPTVRLLQPEGEGLRWWVSIAHDGEYAVASVVAEVAP